MNVIFVEEVAGEYAAVGELVRNAGHVVQVVPFELARATIERELPDISVVGCRKNPATILPFAKLLRSLEDPVTYRSLIAVVEGDSAETRRIANQDPADDILVSSASPGEIATHVRSCVQIVGLERKLRERVIELEGALRRLAFAAAVRSEGAAATVTKGPTRGDVRFLLTHTWPATDDILRTMCGEYLQRPFEQVVGGSVQFQGCLASSITLTDVENELKLELTFLTKPETARGLAIMFTGDESIVDDDIVKDVLLELANSGMGAIAAAFLSEDFRFAASTPKAAPARPLEKLVENVEAKRILTFRFESSVLHVVIAVRSQSRIKVRAAYLREGMVVASDILNEGGLLLVRAGTRLTETSASRISRLMPTVEVELADAS